MSELLFSWRHLCNLFSGRQPGFLRLDVMHHRQRALRWLAALAIVFGTGTPLRAVAASTPDNEFNPSVVDNPLTYDARMVALGGASTAITGGRSGALAIANPALIDQVNQRAVTATFTPYFLSLGAPLQFSNKSVHQISSGTLFGPFSQLGLNMRLNKRVVVGMVAFVTAAAGGAFDRIPLNTLDASVPSAVVGSAQVAQVAGELLVPVAVTINRYVTLAAAYRITHAWQMAKIYNFNHVAMNQASLHGTDFKGFSAGIVSRLGQTTQLGLSFRSQARIDMDGRLKTFGSTTQETALSRRRGFNTPHRIRLGATFRPKPLPKLALMLDARLWLYRLLNPREHNAISGGMGAEYQMHKRLAFRAGYSVSAQPTSEATATPFAAPPGLGHAVLIGSGAQFGDWTIDAATGYLISGKTANQAPVPGRYLAQGIIASVSASYAI